MKYNLLAKGVERLLMVLLCAFSLSLASCSDDDDDKNDAYGKTDYIEVTINGKTYKEFVPNFLYVTTSTDVEGLDLTYSTVDCFAKKGFSFFYGLVHPYQFKALANTKPGTYDVFYNDENLKLFDLGLMYDIRDKVSYESLSGTNIVTSITPKPENDMVIVEGKFDATMEEIDTGELMNIKGKYKMSITVF